MITVVDTTRQVDTYLVRLFDFLPGETLASQTLTADLCFEVGQYAGLLDKALKVSPEAIIICF